MLTSIAHAAAGAPGGATADGAGGMISMFMPLILMFAVFYFLLIRPQQKKTKLHKEMLSKLQKGDSVLTNGGLLGRIVEVEGDILSVDLGDTKVRVPRGYISGIYDPKQVENVANSAPNVK
jgi:preprotein translocase subunit YajC